MPNVKIVYYIGKNFLHVACNSGVAVRDERGYQNTTAQ